MSDNSHLGLDKVLEESGRHPLEAWQLAFCKWLAAHPHSRMKTQEEMATMLSGTPMFHVAIRNMRATKAFRAMYGRYRSAILQRLDEHRETFETENIGKAIKAHSEALDLAMAAKDYRAIPPLVDPAIKALYKHTEEHQDKPMIVLNFGGGRGHLDDAPIDVEYEQLSSGEGDHDSTTT